MKKILLLMIASTILYIPGHAAPEGGAGNDPREVLRQRFQARTAQVIDSLDGVFGLVIQDLTTGETFSVNPDIVFTQASVIKVPVLVELYRQAKAGEISLDEVVAVKRTDFVGGAGILRRLTAGQVSMPVRDLAILMTVLSDNTATNMLIDLVGIENVNQTMTDLGFPGTRLQRKMMDRRARLEDRENISTPAEAARLLELLHKGEILDAASCQEILDILAIPKEGRINRKLPAGTEVANKTGSVGGVVNDIGIVLLENRPFIVVAMVNWNIDREAAVEAIADVSYLAYEYFDRLENSNRFGHRK
jgi:beta-lactamase class A